jgi:hypothetical protein
MEMFCYTCNSIEIDLLKMDLTREKNLAMEKQEKRSGQLIAQPAFRIWLCGTFRVERYVDGHYESIRTAEWGGSSYPRLLLKALLCCPGRQVRREAVMEMLWPEVDSEQAVQCLNTATTKLRKVLEPGKGQANLLVTEDDYKHYLLKGQSFLWPNGPRWSEHTIVVGSGSQKPMSSKGCQGRRRWLSAPS